MTRKKIVISVSVIVVAATLFPLAVIGNLTVLINNHKLKESIVSIDAEAVTLNEIVPFDWDFVYTFEPYLPKDKMEEILGFRSNQLRETVSEGMVQLVFVKGSSVVSSVCGYDSSLGYAVIFAAGEANFSKIAYTDNTAFFVKKREGIVRLSHIENNT